MSKGLKKLLGYVSICLMAVFILPNYVNATQNINYTAYKVGDKITVDLDGEGNVKGEFIVIENSSAGVEKNVEKMEKNPSADYQYVTAIYVGTVGDSIFTNKTAATTYESSMARSNLVITTTNLNWKSQEIVRLLTYNDITNMINTLSESAKNEIYSTGECTETNNNGAITFNCPSIALGTKKINITALTKYFPFLTNTNSYWLGDDSVYQNTVCETGQTCIQVMTNYADAVTSDGILPKVTTTSLALRPVIKIYKGFVEGGTVCNCVDCEEKVCPNDSSISIQACIDGGMSEADCITKYCSTESKTCPNDSSISIQACIDGGMSETDCITKYCSTKSKTCPNDSSISIQACIDGGMSEADCITKYCSTKSKTCPNDSSINIQACIDGGKSEKDCINKLCPGTTTPENPKTGTYISLGIIFGVVIAGIIYFITNKKKYFSKI